jgi:cytochrome P450
MFQARFWDNPDAFKPERFLGDWPREAFLPFSQGRLPQLFSCMMLIS